VPLGDGVDKNDLAFQSSFPYVADPGPGANPKAGYGSKLKSATPAAAASSTMDDDTGVSAWLVVLIALGAAALGAVAVGATRGRGKAAA
jgi:hypothetical protein